MKFKNIIFDWSGPIKDVSYSQYWIVKKMFEELGDSKTTIEEIKKLYEEPYMKFWAKAFPSLSIESEQELYRKTIHRPDCPEPIAYDDIVGLIKKLKSQDIKLVVLSSDFKETVLPEMKKFNLEEIFDEVITFVHDKSGVIHDIIKRNNFKQEETAFIGDSNNEMKAGKEAGIITIAVTWGIFNEEKLKLANPDYLVHNIKELEEILL
ncbi:MAG: HAD family hydrolase [Candidatus Staskawiczbacteria bacterium]|jgi:phosphoglycolate phosphatase-like HAD superfamily hydrolase